MAKEKKKVENGEADPEVEERKRLKKLAHTNNLISQSPAKGFDPLVPTKTVIKHHGKDILKKSQRKNRYLFSFPGLLAPFIGGKIGDLSQLNSKSPVLYLDFAQGRLKLSGTVVYPKNRYLTLQFSKGGKNVVCDDCFDAMIVFSDACWVGKKDENPNEARLHIPEELYKEKNSEFDFQGGAGSTAMKDKEIKKVMKRSIEEDSLPESPLGEMEDESPERKNDMKYMTSNTPVRHSERTAGKRFKFAEVSSGDESAESVRDRSEENEEDAKSPNLCSLDQDPTAVQISNSEGIHQSTRLTTDQVPLSAVSSSGTKESSRGSLVQATISTLFKKVEEKTTAGGSRKTVSDEKMQLNGSKLKKNVKMQVVAQATELRKKGNISSDRKAGAKSDKKKQKAELAEVEDDIEELSSASEGFDGSDEDWRA